MKNVDQNKFKKKCQIFNLKAILNSASNESFLLNSKIEELQKYFKDIKKIMNEKMNKLTTKKNNKLDTNENQIKHQICIKLSNLIKKYNEGKNIKELNQRNEENKNIIKEKMNNVNKMLKQLKYKKLRNEKDLLKQTLKEKKNICQSIKNQIDDEKELNNIFQPINYIYFDNIYNVKYDDLIKKNEETKKLEIFFSQSRVRSKELGINRIKNLKEIKRNNLKIYKKYISDNGFSCTFTNKRHQEKYNIEIELITDYNYSSDSESESSDEETNTQNNLDKDSNKNNDFFLKFNHLDTLDNKIFIPTSEKETNDQEIKIDENISDNKNNLILVNKLVEMKEKYNKLINERYDLEYKKNIILKKIEKTKIKSERRAFSPNPSKMNKSIHFNS